MLGHNKYVRASSGTSIYSPTVYQSYLSVCHELDTWLQKKYLIALEVAILEISFESLKLGVHFHQDGMNHHILNARVLSVGVIPYLIEYILDIAAMISRFRKKILSVLILIFELISGLPKPLAVKLLVDFQIRSNIFSLFKCNSFGVWNQRKESKAA